MNELRLKEAIDKAKETKAAADVEAALLFCVSEEGRIGLESTIELLNFLCDNTESDDARMYACIATTFFWEEGLSALTANIFRVESHLAMPSSIEFIAHAANASLSHLATQSFKEAMPSLYERIGIDSDKYKSAAFTELARQTLVRIAMDNPRAAHTILDNLSFMGFKAAIGAIKTELDDKGINVYEGAFNNMFCAFLGRWFGLNNKVLDSYAELISTPDVSEEQVHQYLAKHPNVLEPFYASLWSKVSLGESLQADFLIRLMDDSYVVVEIEKPTDAILNKNGDLSAKTSHAVRQALEYRDWIASNQLYAKQRFENIWRPSSLVVIGMESGLSVKHAERLKQENESRHGIVRIVGFDWLHRRAEAIQANIIKHTFDRVES